MNTKVTIAGVELKNPVMTASGTFGSGQEYGEFVNLGLLGGVVTKGVSIFHGLETQLPGLQRLMEVCSMLLDFKIQELMCL